jgi:hypothetical protein
MQLQKRNGRLPRFYIDVPALRPGNRRRLRFHFLCAAIGTVLGAAIDPYVQTSGSPPPGICDSAVKLVMSQLLEREGWTVTIGT